MQAKDRVLKIGLLFKPGLKDINQIVELLLEIEKSEDALFYLLDKNSYDLNQISHFMKVHKSIDYILCLG